jgi:putative ABC transport system permease protein
MPSPILWKSSRRYLVHHPVLIGLSILGVALGVAVVVAIDLANSSANKAFQLSAETVAGRATHQIVGTGDDIDEAKYREIRIGLGLRDAAPVVEGFARVVSDSTRTLQVLGVDPLAEAPFRGFTGGRDSGLDLGRFMSAEPTGLLAPSTANELDLGVGDSLILAVDGQERSISLIGVMEPEDERSETAMADLLVVDISSAQRILGMKGRLSRIDLIIPEGDGGARVLRQIESVLTSGEEITRSVSRSETVEQMTRAFRLNLTALSLLALVVGMFLIYNTMTFSVVQRRPMVGRLRSLGVTRREVFTLILSEALLVGAVGTGLGLLTGFILGQGLVQLVTQTINDLYYVLRVKTVDLSIWTFGKGAALGFGATLLAAIQPAREATRAPASTVLRRSEEETTFQKNIPRLALTGLVLAVSALGLLALPGRSITVSYAALLSAMLACALLTPWIVTQFATAVRALLARFGGIVGKMAARGIIATLSRTAVAIAALMIAIAATVGVGVMVESFRSTVSVWLGYTLQADVYISPPSLVFRRNDATIAAEVEDRIRSAPGVDGVYSVRSTRVSSSHGRVDLVVIDPGPRSRAAFRFKDGDPDEIWSRLRGDDIVMVSEPYSYRHSVAVGDSIDIQTDDGQRAFPVRAVFYDYGSDLGAVMMGRSTYDSHFDDPGVSGLALYASPGQDVDELVADMRERVGSEQALLIRSNRNLREASLEVFDRTFTVTIVLRLLAVLVAFVGVLSALMALQLERARELAVLRANGLTPRQVWRYVTTQTGLMGLISGLLSIPLGLILAFGLIYVINKRSFGWTLQVEVSAWILIQALLLALVAALLAGLYPAWKMARANPASALRDE